jgi:hypothetical protein
MEAGSLANDDGKCNGVASSADLADRTADAPMPMTAGRSGTSSPDKSDSDYTGEKEDVDLTPSFSGTGAAPNALLLTTGLFKTETGARVPYPVCLRTCPWSYLRMRVFFRVCTENHSRWCAAHPGR